MATKLTPEQKAGIAAEKAKAAVLKAAASDVAKKEKAAAAKAAQKEKTDKKKASNKVKAKAASEAAAKGAQTQALKDLTPIAKEINVRLKKATGLEDNAYDHRLAAALKLHEAKERAAKSKVNFKKWCEENVEQAYETVRKLVAVGGSENPQLALEDMRGKNKERNKVHRAAKKEAGEVSRDTSPTKPAETPADRISKGFDVIADDQGVLVIKAQAEKYGLNVVTASEASAVRKEEAHKTDSVVVKMKALFDKAKPAEKMEIVVWAANEVGLEIDDGFEAEIETGRDTLLDDEDAGELKEMPEFLKR